MKWDYSQQWAKYDTNCRSKVDKHTLTTLTYFDTHSCVWTSVELVTSTNQLIQMASHQLSHLLYHGRAFLDLNLVLFKEQVDGVRYNSGAFKGLLLGQSVIVGNFE